jgi:hypothetical protein
MNVSPGMRQGQTTSANSNPVVVASDQSPIEITGDLASGVVNSGNPIQIGGLATNAQVTSVISGDRVGAQFDVRGKLVTNVDVPRELTDTATIEITSSTAETNFYVTAAGLMADITQLIFSNNSATATVITLRDSVAGPARMIINIPANATIPISFDAAPLRTTTTGSTWTLQCATSIASLYAFANVNLIHF